MPSNTAKQKQLPELAILSCKAHRPDNYRLWNTAIRGRADTESGYTSGAYGEGGGA